MITPIILSGGNGSRLWPLSRIKKPKQFIKLINDKTMFSNTLLRFKDKENYSNPIILSNIRYLDLIEEEIEKNKINGARIFLEPVLRNTAPAICSIVTNLYNSGNKDEMLVFVPSDAYIDSDDDFNYYVSKAQCLVEEGKIVCFGVKPLYPEVGYGYIKLGEKVKQYIYSVEKFTEKPNLETAVNFLKTDNYLWNAGIFMGKVSTLYEIFKKFQPELLDKIEKCLKNSTFEDNGIVRLSEEYFSKCEDISIDYAIVEHLGVNELSVVSMNLIWSDIGSYKSLFSINKDKTVENNIIIGDNVILNNVKNCYIRSEDKKIICCSDLDDLVIVQEKDVILIIKKDKSQNVKNILCKCKEEGKTDLI